MTEQSARIALAGVIHRAVPEEFEGQPLDLMHLCQDEVCLWYDIADAVLAAGYVVSKPTESEGS